MLSRTRTSDTRGVAPVIGVVLLIGITVILAATVAAFAFGLEENSSQGEVPTVAVGFDYSSTGSDELEIKHKSGKNVDFDKLHVSVSGASCNPSGSPNGDYPASTLTSDSTFASGVSVTIDNGALGCSGADLDLSDATVNVAWRTSTGSSTILRSWNGPS